MGATIARRSTGTARASSGDRLVPRSVDPSLRSIEERVEVMGQDKEEEDRDKPLYMISVAAELTGMHPQTLRVYESKGLINPKRSGGNTRLYSQADIERLQLINQLTDEGINRAGVLRILDMRERAEEREKEIEDLRAQVTKLEDEVRELKVQKRITELAPRDGSSNPEQVMRGLLKEDNS